MNLVNNGGVNICSALFRKSTRASYNGVEDAIAVGDIVILKTESTKRIFWKTAKVEELIRSVDAVVSSSSRTVYVI